MQCLPLDFHSYRNAAVTGPNREAPQRRAVLPQREPRLLPAALPRQPVQPQAAERYSDCWEQPAARPQARYRAVRR